MIQRTLLAFALSTAGVLGCTSSTTPDDPQQSSSDVVGAPSGDKCCDPAKRPPPGIEGEWCCGDGSWQYDIGVGNQVATCKTFGGVGKVCSEAPKPKPTPTCCDPTKKPPPGIEGEWCCGDGSWQYDIGSGNQTVSCSKNGGPGAVCAAGGESCGPPPPVALCAQCPGDDIATMFKWIDGKPTCECCNAAPAKTCGPINGPITCAACPGGKDSYVYKDGKATCECCE